MFAGLNARTGRVEVGGGIANASACCRVEAVVRCELSESPAARYDDGAVERVLSVAEGGGFAPKSVVPVTTRAGANDVSVEMAGGEGEAGTTAWLRSVDSRLGGGGVHVDGEGMLTNDSVLPGERWSAVPVLVLRLFFRNQSMTFCAGPVEAVDEAGTEETAVVRPTGGCRCCVWNWPSTGVRGLCARGPVLMREDGRLDDLEKRVVVGSVKTLLVGVAFLLLRRSRLQQGNR